MDWPLFKSLIRVTGTARRFHLNLGSHQLEKAESGTI